MSVPTEDEIKREALRLRIDKRMSYREITKELGISLGKVSEYLKGIALPILKKSETSPESGEPEKSLQPSVHHLISEVRMSKLFALALDEGYEDPNQWIDSMLLPWYGIKRRFEWMLRVKLNPIEFGGYIEGCMLDSIELREIKERLNKMSSPLVPPAPAGSQSLAPGGKS